ncbi:MAG: hypothetical protein NTY53_05445 [Kiritimatiellaeota bacterium]|nr:hypothetical protein [Kiritimatiellota bacterium]
MKSKLYFVLLLALALAGCATPESRIRQNPALFASFPADVQAKVRQGHIAIGFSQPAVRMALGEPDRIYHRITSTNTSNEVWAYTGYAYRNDPQFVTVLSPVSDPRVFGTVTPNIVMMDVQQRTEYEALRIEFDGEHVKAIEALKH